jgi:hypothetical protein
MKIALVTGPSGSGKTFVADALAEGFDRISYDRLMRDSIEKAFPNHVGDKWDKNIWLDHCDRLDLVAAFSAAFNWTANRPLIVEGWQLRESVWREAVIDLATMRSENSVAAKLFIIRPSLELLMKQRAESKHAYHRRHASAADCRQQMAIHERMDLEQPWRGEICRVGTKEEAVKVVREFLAPK